MVSLADSLVASSSRPLALKMRADLTARRQRYQGQTYWVIKEPIGLKYYRFQEEEFAVLNMMKDGVSLHDIKTRFEQEFAPNKITYQDLQQFLGTLHRSGLVISDAPGQGKQLRKRRDERVRKELMQKFSNVLAVRFKGIDPDKFLDWSWPAVGWFFSKAFAIMAMIAAACALLLVGVQFDEFRSRLPAFESFFGPGNWLLLGATLCVTKVFHEFGHGYLCKKFGGECHEMGVMFLVLTPCLYCNVSDSWMLPNKWHRAAIGAGGIYVEVVLATIATFVWWFSEPGTLNHLALRVMFICSISTILFNGNPLLRFDGYYILSDIVEIPNLRPKASKILQTVAGEVCLGLEMPEDPFLPQRNQGFFALFTIAAVMYRWFIFFSILFFLNKVFEPYGLKILGQLIAAMGMFGLFVQPLWQLGKFFHVPGRMDQVKWPRAYASAAVVVAIILSILFVPLPRRVKCSLQVQAHDAESIYVDSPGTLVEVLVDVGEDVEANQPLMILSNPALQIEKDAIVSQLEQLKVQHRSLKRQKKFGPDAASQIPTVESQIATLQRQVKEKEDEIGRLTLKAPVAGTVLPTPFRPVTPVVDRALPTWTGTVFDTKNLGMYLDVGQSPVVQIGHPNKFDAILAIDQADIDFVHVGQEVELKLDALAWKNFEGKIDEKSKRDMEVSPQAMGSMTGGGLAVYQDSAGINRPMNATYQARVSFEDPDGAVGVNYRGRARVRAGTQTLGARLWRYLARTFHFYM